MMNAFSNSVYRRLLGLLFILLISSFILCSSGCSALGVAANAIPQNVKPQYVGLAGQKVGVMIWADRGLLIDWATIQLDLANSIQTKLEAANTDKSDEVKGIRFPWRPASIVRYQRDHPEVETRAITDVAPELQVTRLIYVEVSAFRTRSETALELFRGQASASLKIIEVDPATNKSRVAYSEDNLIATYPPKVPPDGLPSIGDYKTYLGTVDALGTEVLNRLITHEKERD